MQAGQGQAKPTAYAVGLAAGPLPTSHCSIALAISAGIASLVERRDVDPATGPIQNARHVPSGFDRPRRAPATTECRVGRNRACRADAPTASASCVRADRPRPTGSRRGVRPTVHGPLQKSCSNSTPVAWPSSKITRRARAPKHPRRAVGDRRLEEGSEAVVPAAVTRRTLHIADAVLLLAVDVGIERQPGARRRRDETRRERMDMGQESAERPGGAANLGSAIGARLEPPEIGQHVAIAPADRSEIAPRVRNPRARRARRSSR